MNTSQLSKYAPEARKAFIAAVSAQAAKLGITAEGSATAEVQGDVLLVGGQAFPKAYAEPRKKLVERVEARGFDQAMEAIAYTWFNRFIAIRYMEVHGYLDHGYRVLSHPEGKGRPEILDHAADVDLPGLDREKAIELKLDGTQDEELYRLLLLAQCNALHHAMPFLFEQLGDETELLLPANLLHTDSLIRQLVEQVDEELWQEIEIIGWLYQFYISEKKDQVIGKVVASEDIPAATQLFTPNWIVKYMVQNSLGAQWLATYPKSPLKGQMEYYIEPAEQTDEVNAQLAAITPSQLNPEELTLIDPASGSGHILVEAYELFKAIYLERGYRQRDVPQLILEKNLFGLDIDERAAQLTGFALMMKGRADDRRLFERGVKLNVMALKDSQGSNAEETYAALMAVREHKQSSREDPPAPPGYLFETEDNLLTRAASVQARAHPSPIECEFSQADIAGLLDLFEHATTFGSLIQVPEELAKKLPALQQLSEANSQDMFVSDALKRLAPLVRQAELLATQYDAVVANPPYMGGKVYCKALKSFVNDGYKAGKADLYGAFTLRNIQLAKEAGHVGMITIPNWMFLSSFGDLRATIFQTAPISSLVHNGRGVWGSDFGSCTYILTRSAPQALNGRFLRLFDKQGSVASNEELEGRFHTVPRFSAPNTEFRKIPGSPVAYWLSPQMRNAFDECTPLSEFANLKQGMSTTDSDRFVRRWFELPMSRIEFGREPDTPARKEAEWYPYNKGGSYRNWYGNGEYIVHYEDDGQVLIDLVTKKYPRISDPEFVIKNRKHYFKEAITYTSVSSSYFGVRFMPGGFIFSVAGPIALVPTDMLYIGLSFLCSKLAARFIDAINPTLGFQGTDVGKLPIAHEALRQREPQIGAVASQLIKTSKEDWDSSETSWDFQSLPLLTAASDPTPTLESSYTAWITQNRDTIAEMKRLEEENNRLFIDAYGLVGELTPDVPIEQITLTVNPAYRYGGKLTEEEQWTRFRQDTMEELVSYAIGCMMGRYSLDAPGLIYAHSGNEGFDPSRYATFPADDDGIIPLTDTEWFDDDAAHRLIEFISVAWDSSHLEDNLTFLADNLSAKKNESSRETIRRYLCDKFFKAHLKAYKKRPIYWLFASGKQKAFQCLVYLHRYNEGTLSRMRSEYAIPLQGKMAARIEKLQGDIQAATSTAQAKRLDKERAKLEKQQAELLAFDEKLRHYADRRITLDLDDGVKVNYGKFGDLLAEVKAVHGKKPESA